MVKIRNCFFRLTDTGAAAAIAEAGAVTGNVAVVTAWVMSSAVDVGESGNGGRGR